MSAHQPPKTSFKVEHHGSFKRMLWRKDNGDAGLLWLKPEERFCWVMDEGSVIAAAEIWRVQQYFTNGIGVRLHKLAEGYLRGIVPLKEGMVTINFGANIGEVAIVMAHYGPVLAIEPDPSVLPALKANALSRSIMVWPGAAWHQDGEITLYQRPRTADSSVIDEVGDPVTVPARRIDTLADWHCQGATIDLILGDAEGAEPEVLEGAAETLKRTRYVSVRVGPERHGQSAAPLVRPILAAAGFEILFDADETIIGRNMHV